MKSALVRSIYNALFDTIITSLLKSDPADRNSEAASEYTLAQKMRSVNSQS